MANSAVSQSEVKYFDGDQVRAMANDISDGRSKDVLEVMIGQHPMDCEIRGVKAGLRTENQRMTELEFHRLFGHIGFVHNAKSANFLKAQVVVSDERLILIVRPDLVILGVWIP